MTQQSLLFLLQRLPRIKTRAGKAQVAVITLVLLSGGILLQKTRQAQQKATDLLAQTVVVNQAPVSGEIEASGIVVALRRINISPAAPGRIRRLVFKEGDTVRAGQLLAVMENDQERSRVLQIEAELEGATAEQDADKKKLERFEKLLREAAVSPDEVDELRKKRARSVSTVVEVKERLREAQAQLDKTFVRAPFSGIITQQFAEVFEYVAPATSASSGAGATSTSIAELSKGLEVEAKIAEADLLSINVGQRSRITSNAFPGKVFSGTVKSISPRAVSADNVISFPIRILLSDGSNSLRPEMNVAVSFIQSSSRRTLAVPMAAIETTKNGESSVYVLSRQAIPERRLVKTGTVNNSTVEIVSGLKSGERVFIAPPDKTSESERPN